VHLQAAARPHRDRLDAVGSCTGIQSDDISGVQVNLDLASRYGWRWAVPGTIWTEMDLPIHTYK
jgi:hypothetical protein